MIEVLVSLIVVAFGLLGLAGLQARSMSFQKDSFDRKTAAVIPACGDPLNCSPAETAARDWAMWQIDLRRRLPVSGAYLTAPANSAQINLVLAWQEGQQRADTVDPLCNNAPVNIADTTFRCSNWIINP